MDGKVIPDNLSKEVRGLIARNKPDLAIEVLEKYILEVCPNSDLHNQLTLLSYKLENYQQRKKLNLSIKESEQSDIIYGILSFTSDASLPSDELQIKLDPKKEETSTKIKNLISNNKIPFISGGIVLIVVIGTDSIYAAIIGAIVLILLKVLWEEFIE